MIKDALIFMLSYSLIFVLSFAFMNFATHGFTMKYIKVWASRGKKILVRVNGITKWYIAVGKLDKDDNISFKNMAGKKLIIQTKTGDVNRWHGVGSLLFDEYSGCVVTLDLNAHERAQPAFYSSLIDRIIKTVTSEGGFSGKTVTLWLVFLTVAVIIVGVICFKTYGVLTAPPPVGVI